MVQRARVVNVPLSPLHLHACAFRLGHIVCIIFFDRGESIVIWLNKLSYIFSLQGDSPRQKNTCGGRKCCVIVVVVILVSIIYKHDAHDAHDMIGLL